MNDYRVIEYDGEWYVEEKISEWCWDILDTLETEEEALIRLRRIKKMREDYDCYEPEERDPEYDED